MTNQPVPIAVPEPASNSETSAAVRRPGWFVRGLLWLLALLLAGGAMVYQRATGPTYPYKGTLTTKNQSFKYELLRSHETSGGAPVALPRLAEAGWVVNWRRFPSTEPYQTLPLQQLSAAEREQHPELADVERSTYVARLPAQPAAGKLEYYLTYPASGLPAASPRLPPGEETVVLRYKDPVPDYVLVPHVTAMILVIIIGMRAGLAAVFDPAGTRPLAWTALVLMTVGGMLLGPLVQKYAFGEYWTGFPWGGDWTDNKMLAMWLAWVVACTVLGVSNRAVRGVGRATVLAAAVVMTAVYMIPHSMGGSQLDYSAIDQGVDPAEAIRTGRQ